MFDPIIVPDLGVTTGEVVVTEWLVSVGDFVNAGTPLFTVETDKAVHQVESFRDGYLRRRLIREGSTVAIGAVVALVSDTLQEPIDVVMANVDACAHSDGTRVPKSRGAALVNVPPAALGATRATAVRADVRDTLVGGDGLLEMYRRMSLIRRYEDHLYLLFLQGKVPGTLHQCQGQEAVAVGVCAALRTDDVIFSTHRPVGHLLAKGASIRGVTAEIWGKADGCAGGKGGQMHLVDISVGAMPSNAIVGANIPIAAGAALGFKLRGLDRVAVSFFGDGAANIGAFHEGLNLAAVLDAPAVFVCENNLYAASTHVSLTTRVTDIAERAKSYGIPGHVVDGMDVVAVHRFAAEAVRRARSGEGPTLLECKTYRYPGHSRGDPGNYRDRSEVELWRRRDPLGGCRLRLTSEFGVSVDTLDAIDARNQETVEDAVRFAVECPEPSGSVVPRDVFANRERAG